jgi:hypothetical protein
VIVVIVPLCASVSRFLIVPGVPPVIFSVFDSPEIPPPL